MIDPNVFETVQVRGEGVAPDLLIWRRYKMPAPGVLEAFLAMNPQVHDALGAGPFLPVGAIVRVPIDVALLSGRPAPMTTRRLWGDA